MTPITICAPNWTIAESYGRVAHELRNGLRKRGYHVNTEGEFAPESEYSLCFGGIFLAYPTGFDRYSTLANAGKRICVTMFESDKLPEGWVENLNKIQAVVVPSEWCKEVFISEGVTTPVYVVPLGVSEAYKFHQRQVNVSDDYVHKFVAIGFRNDRKGYYPLCRAFYKAFGDDPHYTLTFKNRAVDYNLKNITKFSGGNMELVRADYSDEEMNDFYSQFDYMAFPSLGEGFGLPPREFAVNGGISLATDYSGLKDNIDTWGTRIPTDGVETAWTTMENKDLRGVGSWAKLDEGVLAERLRYAVINRPNLVFESLHRSEATRALYSWDRFTDGVLEVWKSVNGYT